MNNRRGLESTSPAIGFRVLLASSNPVTVLNSIASRHMRNLSVTVIKNKFFLKMNRKSPH